MSLFIHPENQQLLWSVMNKIPMVVDFFQPYPPTQKEKWFKSVIQLFYEKYKNHTLQVNDLHKLNQETVTYIIESIKERISGSNTQPQRQAPQPAQTLHLDNSRPKQDFYNQQFQNRQTEYKSMYEKPAPPEIDFRQKVEDTAISNMDELMRIHKEQREAEFKQYAPPPNLKIEQTSVNIMAEIIEPEEAKVKKTVSWEQDRGQHREQDDTQVINYEEQLKQQSDEIVYLKSVVTSLSGTIETLCKEMINIRQHIDISSGNQFILDQHKGFNG